MVRDYYSILIVCTWVMCFAIHWSYELYITELPIVQFSELYDKYNSRGLKILAFPCNQFGGQEPVRWYSILYIAIFCTTYCAAVHFWLYTQCLFFCVVSFCIYNIRWWKGTHEEILDFVEKNFHAKDKFTWFEKGHVNGKETREVYSFLKNTLPSEDGTAVSIYTTCAWMPSLVTYHLWYIQMFLVCVINTYDDTLMLSVLT